MTSLHRRPAPLARGVVAAALAAALPLPAGAAVTRLEPLGEAVVPAVDLAGGPVGGLSGLAYDAADDSYLAISDDRSERRPARLVRLTVDLADGRLERHEARVVGTLELRLADGRPFGRGRVDLEAVALLPDGDLLVASEGVAEWELPPFLRLFTPQGTERRRLPLPARYRVAADRQGGVRHNQGLESAAVTPDGRFAFTATEAPLFEDAAAVGAERSMPCRLLRLRLPSGDLAGEFVYLADPYRRAPDGRTLNVAGIVELLALDASRLLALERAFVADAGGRARVYEVDLAPATDVRDVASLERAAGSWTPAAKRLLLDVGRLGIAPDNLEGMAFGPRLADGRRTLVLIADDNFSPRRQVNQVLAFALDESPLAIHDVQGAGHRSPLVGQWVRGLAGVVTGVLPADADPAGFWMETPAALADRDRATAQGLFVAARADGLAAGALVEVQGAVGERGRFPELTVTELRAAEVVRRGGAADLAPPVALRPSALPATVDDDGLASFDPAGDAIDLLESLEGMRVALPAAVAISGTRGWGEVAVLPDGAAPGAARTARGGLLLAAGRPRPERLLLGSRLDRQAPRVAVGDRLGPATAIVDYGFGAYRLEVLAWPPVARRERPAPPAPRRDPARLWVATYNLHNLDPGEPPAKLARLARDVVEALLAPDIVALQEVQDDSGDADDGVVTADETLARLQAAIRAAGGPSYRAVGIDPEDGADGGEPGGNIRVALLLDPRRVELVERGAAGPRDATAPVRRPEGAGLTLSPGRVAPEAPAFAGDSARGWRGSRKCLAAELRFRGRPLVLVNCHFLSKSGDDPAFGARQPPLAVSLAQRTAQAEAIAGFARELFAADPRGALVVIGDLNEHETGAPIDRLRAAGLEALVDRVPAAERYTFNHQGSSQVLDHALASPVAARGAEIAMLHLNADRADAGRASDHDPILVGLALASAEER